MSNYRRIPVEVAAFQYAHGVTSPLLDILIPKFQYDAVGSYFYPICANKPDGDRTRVPQIPDCWMSVETYASQTEAEAAQPKGLIGFCGVVRFSPHGRSQTVLHYRNILPFNTCKIQAGKQEDILDANGEQWKDYAAYMNWITDVEPRGYTYLAIKGPNSPKRSVQVGNWVVTFPNGTSTVMTDEDFKKDYEEWKPAAQSTATNESSTSESTADSTPNTAG